MALSMSKSAYLVFSFCILYANIALSDVSVVIDNYTYTTSASQKIPMKKFHIIISGIIQDDDAELFKKMVTENGKPSVIHLDSIGGSVDAAISIGRQIRSFQDLPPWVKVHDSECISSCVFILAGGLWRGVIGHGLIGIHRPFLVEDTNMTIEEQKKEYKRIEKLVKDYLTEVNVPVSLYDLMFRIPSTTVRYLTKSELQEYNLNHDDPYYRAAADTRSAENLGISKLEYYNMVKELDKCQIYQNVNPPYFTKEWMECHKEIENKYRKK